MSRIASLLVVAFAVTACGDGEQTVPDTIEPESVYAARCQSPRSGAGFDDAKGSLLDEQLWLRSWTDNTYLWYQEVPRADPKQFPTALAYFNVLKTGGYHLEHNFGHGTEHLSALLACLNLLAFAIHTVCDLAEGAWRKARMTLGPRVRFFQSLQALTSYLMFSSWTELLDTLAFARPPPSPAS